MVSMTLNSFGVQLEDDDKVSSAGQALSGGVSGPLA